MNNELIFNNLCHKYSLSDEDKRYLEKIVIPIINNPNFEKRITSEFPHHGSITLGEHIIEDAVLTYKLSKKYLKKKKESKYRIDLAVKIAMLHDLYTIPWQNNKEAKVKRFFNKHGFRHPIEAIINGVTWYPEIFSDEEESKIIIDGVLHHMFPLPVRYLNDETELKNRDLYNELSDSYKTMITNSLKRKKIGPISFSRSTYPEGRIMAKADRKVSRKQIKNLASAKSLITGHNKKIMNKSKEN